ncbi:hypothetical protein [Kitasatospora sp. NPDC057500]|uniref:hypothetical protein n=1 Tax=Kitasatospora sp. NPDC057500 TaxID=3346151 RepID=UPI0036AAA894
MLISFVHDEHGFISALAASPPDAPVAHLVPQVGEFVTRLDVPDVSADGDPQEVLGRLTDVAENFRVDTEARALTRKQA